MSFNVNGAVEVPLEVFGGRVTEMAPTNCPEGVSPDEQDNTFVPGSVLTRPCLSKVFVNRVGTTTFTYAKSFVTPTGAIKNLYLASDGEMIWEDPINAPGVANSLTTVPAGSYAKSITAFGREWIGVSDKLHGSTIPMQWDGTNLDRVTQDGPGTPPTVTSLALASSQLVADPNTLVRNNNTVTANAATPHNLKVGYQAQISNVPDSNSSTVNQTNNAGTQNGSGDWQFVGTQFRTISEPVTTALADLNFTNFGFSIPSAATILGVRVSAELVSQFATTSTLSQVSLWLAGDLLGTIKTPGTLFTTSVVTEPYGGAADDWGAALTPAIVNDPTFGFAMAVVTDTSRVFIGQPFTVTVFYTLSGSGTVAFIESIVINNETNPGLGLVTTTEPHGLAPEEFVSIVGVEPSEVSTIASAQWSAGVTTIESTESHSLVPGSIVQIAAVTTATGGTAFSFDGTFTVATVPSPNQITYSQLPITATDPDVINATANTGNITLSWPILDSPTPSYFTVESAPTPTTFLIPISYSDGTWTTGTVGFMWEGTFYVTAVISPTQFQYQQYGPNGATTAIGTVTPFGQAAPGKHLCRVNFLTRNGALLKPSPWVQFVANGGQYLQIDDIAIGEQDVIVARILEFTGADGAAFFYLPVPGQINGQIVSTATQINDNTTTSIVLDFSDNTLFAGLATSIPGNDLLQQIVIDGALGFGFYGTRLITYGQRNRIQTLLNLGFDGGTMSATPTLPTGWTKVSNGGQLSAALLNGPGWAITVNSADQTGQLSQSAYQNQAGVPILTSNTNYQLRVWIRANRVDADLNFVVQISSVSTGFASQAIVNGAAMSTAFAGSWFDVAFSEVMPATIPEDMELSLWATTTGAINTIVVDDLSVIFADTPYLDGDLYGSYGNNPEAFDGLSGKFGPVTDTRKVMDFGVMRETFYMLTQEPSGRLHETTDNGTTEPVGWQVNEVGANCGALSAFSLTKSQADDTAASGGEEWMSWSSLSGARIFGGSYPDKISQEIQPDWALINPLAFTSCWTVNDPVARQIYYGVPSGNATAPNLIYMLSYRELDSAAAIAANPPFRVSYSGKLVATDNSRKWSKWNIQANSGALMYRSPGTLDMVMCGGNGAAPSTVPGFGQVYTLNPAQLTDDDYGRVSSYYTTYFFVNAAAEQALGLGSHQKTLEYLTADVTWVGTINIQALIDSLTNPWRLSCTRNVSQPNFDLEWGGAYARGPRMAFKIMPSPLAGQTDCAYNLQRIVATLMPATRLKVRGAAQ